jgi:hypothetical protein
MLLASTDKYHSWLSMFSRFTIEAMSSVFPLAALKEKTLPAF